MDDAAAKAAAAAKKQARIASLDAKFAARASAGAATTTTATAAAAKSSSMRAKQQKVLESKGHAAPARGGRGGRGAGDGNDVSGCPEDPSTSLYAPLVANERVEVCARANEAAATKGKRKRVVDMVTSDARDARRAYVEEYTRELLATRAMNGDDTMGDEDDILRAKLSRDKALLLDDATKTLDHGESRANQLKERFAKANAARLSRTALRKRGFYGVPKEKCTWSALATLRAHWDRYAKGLVKDVKRDEARRRLTRGIDLHGCVVKVIRHSRTPDAIGREGCVAFVGGRFLWLVPRLTDAPTLKVLIDGGTFEFTVNEFVVKLNHEDIVAAMPSA
jgi:hypothetical protein